MIEIGDVLKLFVTDTNPPKYKYFFVLGISQDQISLASFYVNSVVNLNVNNNPELVKYNVEIRQEDYPFLDYNSYLDCTKMSVKDKSEFDAIVRNRPEAVIYNLLPEQLDFFRKIIRESPFYKGKILKKFGFFDN